ncbi:MAG: GNAT family N-acetyltransferase [Candidatus Rokubacteria bacterium]|nr:GNAT family N-acetyltransferase [Candidatus Rokubacteria bacterium]
MTDLTLRPFVADDLGTTAHVVYEAFRDVAVRHGFPPVFSSLSGAVNVLKLFEAFPVIAGTVAEHGGRVVGAVFLDEGDPIRAVGLVAVDPQAQARGVGRRLMTWALDRAAGARGVRLVQEAYNAAAMSLYASLGFEVKEPLARLVGHPAPIAAHGRVRPLTLDDLAACAALNQTIHGIDRSADLRDGITHFRGFGLERGGRLRAFTYVLFGDHLAWGVGETADDVHALLAGVASAVGGPISLSLPTRQAGLFRWCLSEGFRVEKPLTLMARGEYHEPRGAWFPSGFY